MVLNIERENRISEIFEWILNSLYENNIITNIYKYFKT